MKTNNARGRGPGTSLPGRHRTWVAVAIAVIMVGSTLGIIGMVTAAAPAAVNLGPSLSLAPTANNNPGPATTLLAGPAETLVPTSGPAGTVVTLTGTGFNDSQTYYYCFEATNTKIGCPSTNSFETTATGVVPSYVNFTLESAEYVVVATGPLSGQYVTDGHFTLQTMDVLSGMVPYVIAQSEFDFMFTNEGPTAGNLTLNLTLYLAMSNIPYLNVLAAEVNTPGTPLYHDYLTPAQFQSEFYPSSTTIAAIENYYRQHGFRVWSESYAPLVIVLDGNVSTIDTQFDVTLYNYNVNSTYAELENSYTYDVLKNPVITNNANPSIPSTYASDITTIYGMSYASDIDLEKAAITACPMCSQSGTPSGTQPGQGGVLYSQSSQTSASAGAGSSSLLTPANLESYFQISNLIASGYNGTGQKTAVVGVGENFIYADIQKYWANYGIVPHQVNLINLSSNGVNQGIDNTEQALDLEWTVAVAPGASTYDVQEAYNISVLPHNGQGGSLGDDSIVMEIYYILNVIDPNTITSSWGMLQFQHDDSWAVMYTQMSLQAVVEGVTYFEGSSDSHSIYYMISEQTPYFMAVGGSDPVLSSTGIIEGQYAWYEPSGSFYGLQVGSGGGSSFFYPKPAYQVNEAAPVPSSYINRSLPDMSMPAEDLSTSTNGNSYSGGGGTSYSAPILAAAFADAESMIAARYGNGTEQYQLGWIQPILYNLGYGTAFGYTPYEAISYLQPSGTIQDGSYLGNSWNEWEGLGTPWMLNLTYDIMNYIAPETVSASVTSNVVLIGGSTSASVSVSHFGAPIVTAETISLGGAAIRSIPVTLSSALQILPLNVSGLLPGLYTVSFSYRGVGIVNDALESATASAEFIVSAQTYAVSFSESGLPFGTTWFVNGTTANQFVLGVNGHGASTLTSLSAAFTTGTIPYTVQSANKNYAVYPATGSIFVNGGPTAGPTFTFSLYTANVVTFRETGLPNGVSWGITLNGVIRGSSTSTISFTDPNATYTYTVANVNGETPSIQQSTITVHGTTSSPVITFSSSAYAVTFTEVGLVSGTSWSATLNGAPESSTSNAITFNEAPGTYSYSIGAIAGHSVSPSSGSVTVTGSSVGIAVVFSTFTYTVSFVEAGSYSGAWAVQLGGVLHSASTGTITFTQPNGSYAYAVALVAGYTAAPSSGSATVSGSGPSITITFSAATPPVYSLEFTENGLLAGTMWSATVTGVGTLSSTGPTITFTGVAAGAYSYSFSAVGGYTAPSGGSVTVSTASVSLSETYVSPTYTVTFTESGLPANTLWEVSFGGSIKASSSTTIAFSVTANTYSYLVATLPAAGFAPSPASGTVVVSGAMGISITYNPIPPVAAGGPAEEPAAMAGRAE